MEQSSVDVHHEMWFFRCDNCMPCMSKDNCEKCDACSAGAVCTKRRCLQAKNLYGQKMELERKEREKQAVKKAKENSNIGPDGEKKKRGRKKGWTKAEFQKQKAEETVTKSKTRNQMHEDNKRRAKGFFEPVEPKQCLAPDCINSSRDQSKYCSDECGKLLAKMRLVEVLPARVQEYFDSPSTAETRIAEMHARTKKEYDHLAEAEKKLLGLLDKLAAFVQMIAPLQPVKKEESEGDVDMYMNCVVCGQSDVSIKRYVKHVEGCFVRSEKAVSYGAVEKSENPSNVFCDAYDQKQKTFCKRLKVICPEHRKPGLETLLRVCGFPAKWDIDASIRVDRIIEDEDPFGREVCMEEQSQCMKHFRWIPTLMGIMQTEQVNLCYRKGEMVMDAQKVWHFQQWHLNVLNVIAATGVKECK